VQVVQNSIGVNGTSRGVRGRVAVISQPGEIQLQEQSFRDPTPGEVRVRIEGCGVCASNLPVWKGEPWFQYPFEPGAPGHEAWGRIDAVGPNITDLNIGDRVALLSSNAFAAYDFASASQVIKLPSSLDDVPVPAEPLGCAMNIFRRSEISAGQTLAIVGAGFLGTIVTRLAANAGANVIAISRRTEPLNLARQYGAHETIQSTDTERVKKIVMEMTLGVGCDCVIEAAGKQTTLDLASELTRELGRLVIAGYHQDGPRQVNMQLWNWRGLDVINAHERDPNVYVKGMKEAVAAIESGALDPLPLYTHVFALDELSSAFNTLDARPGNFMKALVML
jgi:2-desacetyl-2-hydroxyethyl bacteriochlorophyllide A dehydrogenase